MRFKTIPHILQKYLSDDNVHIFVPCTLYSILANKVCKMDEIYMRHETIYDRLQKLLPLSCFTQHLFQIINFKP